MADGLVVEGIDQVFLPEPLHEALLVDLLGPLVGKKQLVPVDLVARQPVLQGVVVAINSVALGVLGQCHFLPVLTSEVGEQLLEGRITTVVLVTHKFINYLLIY